ncbi:MAG: type II toxin-antitoxin system HicA family toxin [Chloroflexi bacterium]|nr:type II toxin-antitoxin system HicA family toxin [Chloroflexota bacterium]
MVDDLAGLSSTRFCRALEALGFAMRHGRTRHAVFVHPDGRRVTVPVFLRRPMPPGTVRAIMADGQIAEPAMLAALPPGG